MFLILFALNNLYFTRLFEITFNKINNRMLCIYCKGGGYLPCICKNGCWKCNDSTLTKCYFCSGDGKGRYAYNRARRLQS